MAVANRTDQNNLPQWEKPVSFFVLKIEVPDDVYDQVLDELIKLPRVEIERKAARPYQNSWLLTCYCTDYSILPQLGSMHEDGMIEEFRII
jgi:hypothetical protein